MSCEIIQFSVAARPARHVSAKQAAAKAEGADEMTNYRSERAAKRAAKLLEVTTAPEKVFRDLQKPALPAQPSRRMVGGRPFDGLLARAA
jgi:hypothetical protein